MQKFSQMVHLLSDCKHQVTLDQVLHTHRLMKALCSYSASRGQSRSTTKERTDRLVIVNHGTVYIEETNILKGLDKQTMKFHKRAALTQTGEIV